VRTVAGTAIAASVVSGTSCRGDETPDASPGEAGDAGDSDACAMGQVTTFRPAYNGSTLLAAGGGSVFGVAPDGEGGAIVDAPPVLLFSQPVMGGRSTPLVRTLGRVSNMSLFGSRLDWYRASGPGIDGTHRYVEWRSLTDDAFGSIELDRKWSLDYMASGRDGIYAGIRVAGEPGATGIYLFRRDGRRELLVVLEAAGPMAADDDALYYLTERFQGALVRRSLADGTEMTLGTDMSWEVVLDRDHVYTHGPNDLLVRFEKATGKEVTAFSASVAPVSPPSVCISKLGNDVVWCQMDGYRRARPDGSCTELLPLLGVVELVDGDAIFVRDATSETVSIYR
jgi:hypothetical protein